MKPGRTTSLLLAAILLTPCAAGEAATTKPTVVPAFKQWTPAPGAFRISPRSRVIADPPLARTAQMFAAGLHQVTGHPILWRPGGAVRPGDIRLELRPGPDPEGYRLTIGPAITLRASTPGGVFYGTRTILQLLRQRPAIPAGTAVDKPVYPERGLMLDVGRNYFPLPWLRARIRQMSYLKLNYLHLHLSDRLGFRLESTTHPEIVSPRHYTKRQLRDLITYAAYSPRQLIAAGHRVMNNAFTPTYYTLGPVGLLNSPPGVMYDWWRPGQFIDGTRLTGAARTRNLGAKLAVWCDVPNAQTEPQIARAIAERLPVLAQQLWGSPRPAPTYQAFLPLVAAVGPHP